MTIVRTVALIGNPNAGKTTLFNQLTGSKQRVGNWAGVTVECQEGYIITPSQHTRLIDLPGTYSLTTLSQQSSLDEQITCRYILEQKVDLLINVIDAVHLERNLYLTLQLLELDIPCIIALNMMDVACSQGITIDIPTLEKQLDCPVVPLVSTSLESVKKFKIWLNGALPTPPSITINYAPIVKKAMQKLFPFIPKRYSTRKRRWLVLNILEGDIHSRALLVSSQSIERLRINVTQQDIALAIADGRYHKIISLCQTVSNCHLKQTNLLTERLDSILLNRWFSVPIFFTVMYLMFILAINFGGAFKPILESGSSIFFIDGIQWLGYWLHMPKWIILLLTQGVGGAINTIIPLIPQIGIMHLCLSFLEGSGYMARAAFVIDRLMQSLGLPGKSFVPLIVGFGCNVPSVMGTRTLSVPRERLITIMMAPFMSCGARLAIFAVFSATFFSEYGATLVFSLYLLGIVVAIFTGLMLKLTLMRGESVSFVMELPVYHLPNFKNLLLQTWQRLKSFVLRAGKVIILASVLISILNSFTIYGKITDSVHYSALAALSKKITPLFEPIGIHEDNWQATVALISGTMAKEVVVGTLNTLYSFEKINHISPTLETFDLFEELSIALKKTWKGLQNVFSFNFFIDPIGINKRDGEINIETIGVMSQKFGSATAVYSYLIFVLLYVPCISVLGAIVRESSRSWMMLSALWGVNVAYSLSTLFYQISTFMKHPLYSVIAISIVIVINSLLIVGLYYSRNCFKLKQNLIESSSFCQSTNKERCFSKCSFKIHSISLDSKVNINNSYPCNILRFVPKASLEKIKSLKMISHVKG